jgi:intraflagellar transport protein 46
MPDIETLMDVWPESFEQLLRSVALPSPDLDLSLLEYVKVLCAVLDIPVYDNPIESLHVMFSLFMDFRDNPHFQAMKGGGANGMGGGGYGMENNYGGADVMELNSEYK